MNPIYTTVDSVKIRLVNKIKFQKDSSEVEEGEMPTALLLQIISDAETEVEQELRSRYAIPFQSKRTGQYSDLPDHSKRALRVAVDLKAVIMILETDFGRGTHINAEGYVDPNQVAYKKSIENLRGDQPEDSGRRISNFKRPPPLEDLKLAQGNREADDGYSGMIINTDASQHDAASYAEDQINNPSKSYIRSRGYGMM